MSHSRNTGFIFEASQDGRVFVAGVVPGSYAQSVSSISVNGQKKRLDPVGAVVLHCQCGEESKDNPGPDDLDFIRENYSDIKDEKPRQLTLRFSTNRNKDTDSGHMNKFIVPFSGDISKLLDCGLEFHVLQGGEVQVREVVSGSYADSLQYSMKRNFYGATVLSWGNGDVSSQNTPVALVTSYLVNELLSRVATDQNIKLVLKLRSRKNPNSDVSKPVRLELSGKSIGEYIVQQSEAAEAASYQGSRPVPSAPPLPPGFDCPPPPYDGRGLTHSAPVPIPSAALGSDTESPFGSPFGSPDSPYGSPGSARRKIGTSGIVSLGIIFGALGLGKGEQVIKTSTGEGSVVVVGNDPLSGAPTKYTTAIINALTGARIVNVIKRGDGVEILNLLGLTGSQGIKLANESCSGLSSGEGLEIEIEKFNGYRELITITRKKAPDSLVITVSDKGQDKEVAGSRTEFFPLTGVKAKKIWTHSRGTGLSFGVNKDTEKVFFTVKDKRLEKLGLSEGVQYTVNSIKFEGQDLGEGMSLEDASKRYNGKLKSLNPGQEVEIQYSKCNEKSEIASYTVKITHEALSAVHAWQSSISK